MADEQLQLIADGELVDAEVRRHVDACTKCSGKVREIALAGEAYKAFHDDAKANDPAPPMPWEDLRTRMTTRRSPWRSWAVAAAAVLIIAAAGYFRIMRPVPVS